MKFQLITKRLPDSVYETFTDLLGKSLQVVRGTELTIKGELEGICLAWNSSVSQTIILRLKYFENEDLKHYSESVQRYYYGRAFSCMLATSLNFKEDKIMTENLEYMAGVCRTWYLQENFPSASEAFLEWANSTIKIERTLDLGSFSFEKLLLVAKGELSPAKYSSSIFLTKEITID